jgi:hypothetical protein
MAPEKFVLRLVDAAGDLLAWATVYAQPSPQDRAASCPFWPVDGRTTPLVIEREGVTDAITVHWCALDVARQSAVDAVGVAAGQVFAFTWIEPVWLVSGMRGVPLPAVTERASVVASAPTGTIAGA